MSWPARPKKKILSSQSSHLIWIMDNKSKQIILKAGCFADTELDSACSWIADATAAIVWPQELLFRLVQGGGNSPCEQVCCLASSWYSTGYWSRIPCQRRSLAPAWARSRFCQRVQGPLQLIKARGGVSFGWWGIAPQQQAPISREYPKRGRVPDGRRAAVTSGAESSRLGM